MKRPLVSVIVNCFNGEQYLKECIQSIINQTYTNFEIIFWNNNSSDNSKKIFYKFKDKRFRYFENKGLKNLYDARNLAVNKAKGEYLCFLDTDDWWKKEKIQKQITLFKKNDSLKFVYSNFYLFDQESNKKVLFSKKKLPEGNISQQLLNNYSIGILTVMIKTKLIKKDKFNKSYNVIGDFDLFLKLSNKYKIQSIQDPLAFYREHKQNYSKLKSNQFIKELIHWTSINSKKKRV